MLGASIFHISLCHLCDFAEPVTTPRKVEERGENKVKRKEGDKKVMSKR
jgi:hypothetical protein